MVLRVIIVKVVVKVAMMSQKRMIWQKGTLKVMMMRRMRKIRITTVNSQNAMRKVRKFN